MLHVHRVERLEEFACLREPWNALLYPENPRAVFLSHEWTTAWFAAYGAGRSPYVLVASQGGAMRGILPLCAGRDRVAGLPARRLELMANGHSPCADLIAAPGFEPEVAAAFANHLQELDLAWDVAVFHEVPEGAALDAFFAAFPAGLRLASWQRRSPYLPVAGTYDAYRATLSKNFQRSLRHNRNRIARAGAPEVELLVSASSITASLDDLFAIGERSWQGEARAAVGSKPENRAFYRGLVRELAAQGVLRLFFLKLAGVRVAFELHVRSAGVEFGLKTGFDRAFEAAGPGTFLDQSIVEALFAEGQVREYDLLGNADPYKLRWTSQTRPYRRLTVFGTRGTGRVGSLWNVRLKPVLRQARDLRRRARAAPALDAEPGPEADTT